MAPVKDQRSSIAFTEPMECKPVERLPEGEGWTYEVKLDGYRAQAIREADTVRLLSRNAKSLTDQFPGPVRDLQALPPGTVVDGEIVAVDEQGRPSFQLLQNRGSARPTTIFYAFDLLLLRHESLLQRSLSRTATTPGSSDQAHRNGSGVRTVHDPA